MSDDAVLFRAVDRASFAVAFSERLRTAGISVDLTATELFTEALTVQPADNQRRLYWLGRVTLVRRRQDLDRYDAVFAAVFADTVVAVDPQSRRRPLDSAPDRGTSHGIPPSAMVRDGAGLPWITMPTAATGRAEDANTGLAVPERLPSALTGLRDTPFDALDPVQLAEVGAWLESAREHWPTRRTRRFATRSRGTMIDLRATMARSRSTGWEPTELVRTGPVHKPRRLVMLCDVSQSMQAFITPYLHLMRAATISAGAEVFAFGTTLTRLTAVLAHRDVAVAVDQASTLVADRFGGTRIATNVAGLLKSRYGALVRGAVVIIASDGWDSDDPEQLARTMARLSRRAHRVIWMNPRVAAPGYQPLTGALVAALPYCDALLPGNTLDALAEVVNSTR
ncbi:VWA domain-containing protein [Kribbella sp. NPDC050281]|uniref:vWA domain-containing protein n=1 Tax=Kribbella sp. NPDC050281 TaxID=3155515 RepID=UPI0033CAA51A